MAHYPRKLKAAIRPLSSSVVKYFFGSAVANKKLHLIRYYMFKEVVHNVMWQPTCDERAWNFLINGQPIDSITSTIVHRKRTS